MSRMFRNRRSRASDSAEQPRGQRPFTDPVPHVARRPVVPAGRCGRTPPGRRSRHLPGDRAAPGTEWGLAATAPGRLPGGRASTHRRSPCSGCMAFWIVRSSATFASPRVPGLLPQHGPEGVVGCRSTSRRRCGSCGLGGRTTARAHPARRRHHGLGARAPVRPVADRRGFPRQKVAVEVDGWAWHVDAERFRNDRRKQNALVRSGWDPLRFTWHDLDGRPDEVAAEIGGTLATAA